MATIRRRGTRWQAQVRRVGSSTQTKSFPSKTEAVEWSRALEAFIDKGAVPQSRNSLKSVCFGELLERYLSEVTPTKRGSSEESYRLAKLIADPIAKLQLTEVTHAALSAYRDQRLKVVCPTTVQREFVLIRHCFQLAMTDWNLPLLNNPASSIRFAVRDGRRERRLMAGELELLEACSIKARNPLVWQIIKFAIATGMRRGEILGMHWSNLHAANKSLLIPCAKNGQARTIPLSKTALNVLGNLSPTQERVFPMTPNALRLSWVRLTGRAGIKDLHFHDLRHEAISRFFEMGLSTPEVALISGHRDLRMLFRYAHPTRQRILEKLDSVERQQS